MKLVQRIKTIKTIVALPHTFVYKCICRSNNEIASSITEDLMVMNRRCNLNKGLAYYLVNRSPYRNVFYYRIGGRFSKLLKIILPEYKGFYITSNVKKIGGGIFALNHPYGTILNCKSIGKNFTVCQLTTLGNK